MSNEHEALERARIFSEALDSSEKPKIGEGQYDYAKRADLPRMLREQAKDALFFECEPHVTVDAWNIVQMAADELEARVATPSPAPSDTLERREAIIAAMAPHGWLGEQCVTDILAALSLPAREGITWEAFGEAVQARFNAGIALPGDEHWFATTLADLLPAREVSGERLTEANRDCITKAKDGEPMFIILGRDPDGGNIVRLWAERRANAGDPEHAGPVFAIADEMDAWRSAGNLPDTAPAASAYPSLATTPAPREMEADLEALKKAARVVLGHRVGDLPTHGWLRDNDASRKAIAELAATLAKLDRSA